MDLQYPAPTGRPHRRRRERHHDLDIPLQHARREGAEGDEAPGRRRQGAGAESRAWRAICPDLTYRSTFIVGFPGQTDADFAYLLDWLDEARLDRVGCFKYRAGRRRFVERNRRSR